MGFDKGKVERIGVGALSIPFGTRSQRKADGSVLKIEGEGNGPIDAFVDALQKGLGVSFSFLDYHEHAVGRGANATAASYVEIQDASGHVVQGVGMDPSIVTASLKAILSAVQRLMAGG